MKPSATGILLAGVSKTLGRVKNCRWSWDLPHNMVTFTLQHKPNVEDSGTQAKNSANSIVDIWEGHRTTKNPHIHTFSLKPKNARFDTLCEPVQTQKGEMSSGRNVKLDLSDRVAWLLKMSSREGLSLRCFVRQNMILELCRFCPRIIFIYIYIHNEGTWRGNLSYSYAVPFRRLGSEHHVRPRRPVWANSV